MNKDELFRNRKFGFASIIGMLFMGFIAGWVFLIPTAAAVFLLYGYVAYNRDQKHRISVNYKPSEAMKAIARQEMELKNEKERIMYEQKNDEIRIR